LNNILKADIILIHVGYLSSIVQIGILVYNNRARLKNIDYKKPNKKTYHEWEQLYFIEESHP